MSEIRKETVLETEGLTKRFTRHSGALLAPAHSFAAVDHVSFSVFRGEMLGLLGESGCGKSTLARMLMHLIRPDEGTIRLNGTAVQDMPEAAFRKMRHSIQMVFQNPFDCLDPSRKIAALLDEPLKRWERGASDAQRRDRVLDMLQECGLDRNSLDKYPREFSGGQLQRISIARALLAKPGILIADEIVSALDVSVQSQILALLEKMKEEHDLAVLFITHDLSVARKVSDRIMVMREGRIRAIGDSGEIFQQTQDPYIRELAEAAFTFCVD